MSYDIPPEALESLENGNGTVIVDPPDEDHVLVFTDRPDVIASLSGLDRAERLVEDSSSGVAVFRVKGSFDYEAGQR